MHTLVFCLEERSAWEMLKGILPKLLPESVIAKPIIFEGKSDLDKRLEKRMRLWLAPNTHFLVLRDKDSGDCHQVKSVLAEKARTAGRADAVIRIACHELESFYLGDLRSVERGLGIRKLSKLQSKRKFRDPDAIANAAEVLSIVTERTYQKISGSRAISCHLAIDGTNRSQSYNVLVTGIREIVERINEIKI